MSSKLGKLVELVMFSTLIAYMTGGWSMKNLRARKVSLHELKTHDYGKLETHHYCKQLYFNKFRSMSDHYQKSTNITWLEYGYKLKTIIVEMEPKMVRERLLSGQLETDNFLILVEF